MAIKYVFDYSSGQMKPLTQTQPKATQKVGMPSGSGLQTQTWANPVTPPASMSGFRALEMASAYPKKTTIPNYTNEEMLTNPIPDALQQVQAWIKDNPDNAVAIALANSGTVPTGSGSGGSGGSGSKPSALSDYDYAANKTIGNYNNALGKYELQVKQALEETTLSAQQSYVEKMQAQRVMGNQLTNNGMANTGYRNIVANRVKENYNNAYSSALTGYNRTVQSVNQNVKDLAYGYNQDLADLYRNNSDVKGAAKKTVKAKTYPTR